MISIFKKKNKSKGNFSKRVISYDLHFQEWRVFSNHKIEHFKC